MCGITGSVWLRDHHRVDDALISRMTHVISHRGPNDAQVWADRSHRDASGNPMGVALGFRRLSIIDVAGSRQPMANEDGRVRMVFNGEIYNYRELASASRVRGIVSLPRATASRFSIFMKISVRTARAPQRHVCDRNLGRQATSLGARARSNWAKTAVLFVQERATSIRQRAEVTRRSPRRLRAD